MCAYVYTKKKHQRGGVGAISRMIERALAALPHTHAHTHAHAHTHTHTSTYAHLVNGLLLAVNLLEVQVGFLLHVTGKGIVTLQVWDKDIMHKYGCRTQTQPGKGRGGSIQLSTKVHRYDWPQP
jgi:hypothetical protein